MRGGCDTGFNFNGNLNYDNKILEKKTKKLKNSHIYMVKIHMQMAQVVK